MKNWVLALFVAVSLPAMAQKGKWVSLFDGKQLNGWHNWKSDKVSGWEIKDGVLSTDGKSGDLVTDKEYENFILEFEFNVAPKGNSGIIYKVLEDANVKEYFASYSSGPEYQIIDDKNYPSAITDKQKTGANYDVYQPNDFNVTKPAGEWNKGKIVINQNKVEHWLNGKKVVEYMYGSEQWATDVAGSKFAKWAYATPHPKGKIALQDHGDRVSFKNIRIKEL